jgi:hypothetical protein
LRLKRGETCEKESTLFRGLRREKVAPAGQLRREELVGYRERGSWRLSAFEIILGVR